MATTLTGILAWIYTLVTLTGGLAIIILGSFHLFNVILWNGLIPLIFKNLKIYRSFYDWLFSRREFDDYVKRNEEYINQRLKELSMLELSHTDNEWFYVIEQIQKGHCANLVHDGRYNEEWIRNLCTQLGYSTGDLDENLAAL